MALPLLPVITWDGTLDTDAIQFNQDQIALQFPLPYLARGVKTILDYDPKVNDGVTPADTALAAYLTANPNRGLILLPPGTYLFNSPWPTLKETASVTVLGFGGRSAGAATSTKIVYAGSTAPFIDARSSYGFKLTGVQVEYTNASFAGKLIDYSHSIAQDAAFGLIDGCTIGGNGSAVNASALVSFNRAIECAVRNTKLFNAVCAVKGADTAGTDYSNAITLDNVEVSATSAAPIQNPGQGWVAINPTAEGLSNGNAGYLYCPSDATGFTVVGGWMGDVNSSGSWFDFQGDGLTIFGTRIEGGDIGVKLRASSFGCTVRGVTFKSTTTAIEEGANCRRNDLGLNDYQSVTTPISNAGVLEEQLWTLRGAVAAAGTVASGQGFTVSHPATGRYVITYTIPFSAVASPTATLGSTLAAPATIRVLDAAGSGSCEVRTYDNTGALADSVFFFQAQGPR